MNKKTIKTTLISTAISGLIYSPLAFSDDIEIYTGTKDDESIVNIMFLLDTSGSMDYGVGGSRETRMDQAQSALKQVINELPGDMRVGLSRFNTPGASILTPARALDDIIEQDIIKKPSDDDSDAYEREGQNDETVVYSDELLFEASKTKSISKTITFREGNGDYDAEECSGGGSFSNAESTAGVPFDNSYCPEVNGFIFKDLNIPRNAQITSAQIELTTESSGTASRYVSLFIENNEDPSSYINSSGRRIENRNYYSEKVDWYILSSNKFSKVYSPDLSNLVQKIVDKNDWTDGNNGLGFKMLSNTRWYDYYYENNRYYFSDITVDSNSPKLNVSYMSGGDGSNLVGIKFDDIQIPSKGNVKNSRLKLIASRNNGSGVLNIALENNMNPKDYIEEDNNISNRNKTSTTLSFPYTNWNAGEERFFDVTSLIQNHINNANWCGGKDINFIITSDNAEGVYSKDKGESFSPELSLRYGGGDSNSCLSNDKIIQVDDHSDDAHEDPKKNKVDTYKSAITMKKNGGLGGFIFRNIGIPTDANITEAYMQFTSNTNDPSRFFDLKLNVVQPNVYPIPAYTNTKNLLSEGRGTKFAEKSWSLTDVTKNKVYSSPDISNELTSIIRSTAYASANEKDRDLEIVIKNNTNQNLKAISYDNNPGNAAKLIIRYEGSVSPKTLSTKKIKVNKNQLSSSNDSPLTVRQHLLELVDQQPTNGGTPMEGSLYEVGQYFMGGAVDYGRSRNYKSGGNNSYSADDARISGEDTYVNGKVVYPNGCTSDNLSDSDCRNIYINGNPTYVTPMTDEVCETNNIILITDGEPNKQSYYSQAHKNYNNIPLATLIRNETGAYCNDPWACANAWVSYIYKSDFMKDKAGLSNIFTHIIGYADLASADKLRNLSNSGGGTFVTATNTDELVDSLNLVISSIMKIESTMATPGVAVNQNNRTEHLSDVYYSVFQPSISKSWFGNLKKYQISSEKETIVDKFNVDAVDEKTGFFKGKTTSFWSNEEDGGVVEKGGAANKQTLNRRVFTYTGSSSSPKEVSLNQERHKIKASNNYLTRSIFGLTSSDMNNTEFTQFLNWLSGIDVFDENLNGLYDDPRKIIGDPLHSRPILVSYGENKNIIFVSTNEGFLHAIDASNGNEEFSFIPKELLPNSPTIYSGGSGSHIYGLDSSWIAWRKDNNKDGVIKRSDGDFVYIYSGMRRGGESFYALDVTDTKSPILKFVKSSTQNGLTEMGQTWSEPVLGKIKINGIEKAVVIMAGGYDSSYDNEKYNGLTDSVGNYIYMFDAHNGELLYKISNTNGGGDLQIPSMSYSMTSKPNIIDFDGDGYIDYIYQTDLASQIIKISIDNQGNTGKYNLATGKVIAKLGKSTGDVSMQGTRMMFDSVAVSPIRQNGEKYMAIVAGTGYRSHPLNKDKEDLIIVIKDKENYYSTGDQEIISSPILINDLYDATKEMDTANAKMEISKKSGYVIKLKESNNSYIGEKVTGNPLIYDNQIFLTTYVPNEKASECVPVIGYSRGYEFDLASGIPSTDKNNDGIINEKDRYYDNITTGIANGSQVIYTENGNYLLTNTDVRKVSEGGSMGNNKKRWYIEKNVD